MQIGDGRVDPLSDQVRCLEATVGRWRGLTLAIVLIGATPWVVGAAGRPTDREAIRVSSLILVAPDGNEYATLSLQNGAPVLALRDGTRHATLTLADGSAGLACGGPEGVTFAGVSSSGAYFNARGSDLRTGVFAGVASLGAAAFRAYGCDMRVAASLEADAGGTPTLMLRDPRLGESTWPSARK